MYKRATKALRIIPLLAICLAVILNIAPVSAIANPTTINVMTAKFFQNIFTTGDGVLFVSYNIHYAPGSVPTQTAAEAFQLELYKSDNVTIAFSKPLNYYQYNVIGLYFTPTQMTDNITWGTGYWIRVAGNPGLFSRTENVNMDTYTLSSADWILGAEALSHTLMKSHCIDIAEDMQAHDGITTYVVNTPVGKVLNSVCGLYFKNAISGLDTAIPELFQYSSETISVDQPVATGAFGTTHTMTLKLGAALTTAFGGIGTWLGFPAAEAAMWAARLYWLLIVCTLCAIVFLNTGSSEIAIVLSLPFIALGTFSGIIPPAMLFTGAGVIVIAFGYYAFLRGL